jgi:O-antigen/teichoic acid export membrane protein
MTVASTSGLERPVAPVAPGPPGPPRAGDAGPSLRATVRHGTLWSMFGYGGAQVLRFGGNLVLTRLLFPEAFGVMSLVNALLVGLQLFSDVGIGPSIVQNRRGNDPAFLHTAWTVQILRGLALWLAACAVASPFATFYGDARLAWIVPLSGLTALIAGFESTRVHGMYRRVQLARVSVIELGSQAFGLVVMIAWALLDRSLVSLVAGGLAGASARLVLSHAALPGARDRLAWDRDALRQLVRFGRWIFLSTLLTFLVGQADRLVFGKLVPMAMLGVFGVGALIALAPAGVLARMASRVLFPVYSRVRNAGEDLAGVVARVRRPMLVFAAWMVSGLAGGGAVVVTLLYDPRYEAAGWMVQMLALGSWFAVLEATNGAALLACGRPHWIAASGAGKLLGMLLLIPAGFALAGFPGAVAGLAASEVFRYAVSAFAVGRVGLASWRQDLRLTAWTLASAAVAWGLAGLAQQEGLPLAAAAAVVLIAVTLLWTPSAVACLRADARRRRRTA